ADNLRFDAAAGQVVVGYGSGALAIFALDGKRGGDIPLSAHPEAFQMEAKGSRIFVNVPRSREVTVVDRRSKAVLAHWSTGGALANFPMALDEVGGHLF